VNSRLTLPAPKVCALLVLVFLGFGVILGAAAGSRVDDTLAASARPPIKLILPRTAPVTSTPASEPPPSSVQSTPTPAGESESEPTPAAEGSSNESSTKTSSGSSKKSSSTPSSTSTKSGSSGSSLSGSSKKLPPVKHVFVIMLSDEPYATVFGPASVARYLTGTLEAKGELLVRYYAVAHEQLANGIALLSGQGPTPQTAQNCPTYEDLTPGTVGASGQASGHGCVYPSTTQTLAGQLTAKHLTWKAYVEGMAQGAQSVCAHPALGAADPTSAPAAGQAYATFSNPFLYFHAVIDSAPCASEDVGLSRLKSDLASAKSTPSFSYIAPDRCHDGNPTPCAAGAGAGMGPADSFLQRVVPEILGSKGYKEGGLLVITTDEAPSSGEFADSSSCCAEPRFPNLPAPAGTGLSAKGGGEVGALLLSSFVKPHTTNNQEQYNHFSLLRTIEDLYGLKHLGYAGSSGVSSFGSSVFSAYTPH
jgi:hypothetical protein